jgi:hypothetical protein
LFGVVVLVIGTLRKSLMSPTEQYVVVVTIFYYKSLDI